MPFYFNDRLMGGEAFQAAPNLIVGAGCFRCDLPVHCSHLTRDLVSEAHLSVCALSVRTLLISRLPTVRDHAGIV
eukprot:2854632-Amphidinium_carterae.3